LKPGDSSAFVSVWDDVAIARSRGHPEVRMLILVVKAGTAAEDTLPEFSMHDSLKASGLRPLRRHRAKANRERYVPSDSPPLQVVHRRRAQPEQAHGASVDRVARFDRQAGRRVPKDDALLPWWSGSSPVLLSTAANAVAAVPVQRRRWFR